jgi:hypothetical protein
MVAKPVIVQEQTGTCATHLHGASLFLLALQYCNWREELSLGPPHKKHLFVH